MAIDNLLKQGIAALKAGRKAEACKLLMQVVKEDKHNEIAWLWLSGAVDTDRDRCICLEKVLAINPYNELAKRGLVSLTAEADEPLLSMSVSQVSDAEALSTGGPTDVSPQSKTESRKPMPRRKAEWERTNSHWKWLLLGISGTAILLVTACLLAYLVGLVELPTTTTVDSSKRESIHLYAVDCWGGDVPVTISYPTIVESGTSTYIEIDISNSSDTDWDGIRVRFDSSMVPTGDHYFTGFALDNSRPSPTEAWSRSDGVLAWVKWNSTRVPVGKKVSLRLGLRAIKPGGYGTRITVILDQGDSSCSVNQIIHATIK